MNILGVGDTRCSEVPPALFLDHQIEHPRKPETVTSPPLRVLERTLRLEALCWIVAEEFLDSGRAKLVEAGKQQIAIAELEGWDGQHGLRLVGKASGAQHPRRVRSRVPDGADYRPIFSAGAGQRAGNAPASHSSFCAHQSLSPLFRFLFAVTWSVSAPPGTPAAVCRRELGRLFPLASEAICVAILRCAVRRVVSRDVAPAVRVRVRAIPEHTSARLAGHICRSGLRRRRCAQSASPSGRRDCRGDA
jgi:hypothetical protein